MRDYTDAQRQRTAEDITHIINFLIASLYVDDDNLFSGFIAWTAEHPHRPKCAVRHIVSGARSFGYTAA
jgi:hypothetical protein